MKKLRLVYLYAYFVVIHCCLLLPFHLHSTDREDLYISREELSEILDNAAIKYLYLGKEFSQLYDVISRIKLLEDDQDSQLGELQQHIEDGYSVGLYAAILETLEYAQKILENNFSKLSPEEAEELSKELEKVVNQVVNDALTIDTKGFSASVAADVDAKDMITRCGGGEGGGQCCPSSNLCKVIKVREPLDVFDNARFKKKLKVFGKACFFEEVCFKEDVKFKEDVLIKGNLTVDGTAIFNGPIIGTISEIIIESISATDIFVENLSVVDLVVLSCMDHLCVKNLSVVDATIDNLTVNNCMTSLCVENFSAVDASIDNLSATNAFITNLSVTDIIVVGCLGSLCVQNLSVVDESVSGTLSVNDEFVVDLSATNATIANLTVTNCVASLCVDNLSAVDVSISGELSANDAAIDNLSVIDLVVISCVDNLCVNNLSVTDLIASTLSLCDLIVNCDIFMNNSTSPAVGNIFKAGNRFIHNFGTDNTFIGIDAGNFSMGGAENTGVGRNALISNATGFNNVAVGSFALATNTIGANNDAMGTFALVNNTLGNQNVGLGNSTLASNTTGSGNTATGFQAGFSLATGNNNVFIGNNAALNVASGFTNVIIGYNSGFSLITGDNNIYIANPGIGAETGIIRIGTPTTHTATFIQGIFGTAVAGTGVEVFVDANGQLGTVVSSAARKRNIRDMDNCSADILKLRPVEFMYREDANNTIQYGLIAEEVNQIFPELVVQDGEGKPYTVRYHLLPSLLLNEVQKLHNTVQEQAVAIAELTQDNKKMRKLMHRVLRHLNIDDFDVDKNRMSVTDTVDTLSANDVVSHQAPTTHSSDMDEFGNVLNAIDVVEQDISIIDVVVDDASIHDLFAENLSVIDDFKTLSTK